MRRRHSSRELFDILQRLTGVQVKVRVEDQRRAGMAMHYVGNVALVWRDSGRYKLRIRSGGTNYDFELSKVDAIEIAGALAR